MSRKPSVLLVVLAKGFGGVNQRILQTAQALEEKGWRYSVVVLSGSPLEAELLKNGYSTCSVVARRADPRLIHFLRREARRIGATVVDAHNMQSQLWSALAFGLGSGIAKLASVHTNYRIANSPKIRGVLHECALHICRLGKFHFLTVSESIAVWLTDIGVSNSRIIVSRNGLEPIEIIGDAYDPRDMFGWPKDDFVFSFVGRLEYQKNLELLIEAFLDPRIQRHPNVRLVLIGDGSRRETLEILVGEKGAQARIGFTGYRGDAVQLLGMSNALCLTSHAEGLPYVMLEAAALAVPVVSSAIDGAVELFLDEEDVLFFPPNDQEKLVQRMEWAVTNPRALAQIGESFHAKAQRVTSPEKMKADTLEYYQKLSSEVQ